MSKITVVNKYKHDATNQDIFIGRGSPFGNPYTHLDSKFNDVIKCDTREEAIESHKKWFYRAIKSCGCKNKDMKNGLRSLLMQLRLGEDINLVCYCKPKACHGDTIKEYLLKELENDC